MTIKKIALMWLVSILPACTVGTILPIWQPLLWASWIWFAYWFFYRPLTLLNQIGGEVVKETMEQDALRKLAMASSKKTRREAEDRLLLLGITAFGAGPESGDGTDGSDG